MGPVFQDKSSHLNSTQQRFCSGCAGHSPSFIGGFVQCSVCFKELDNSTEDVLIIKVLALEHVQRYTLLFKASRGVAET